MHTLHYYKRLEEGDYVHSEEVLFDQEAGTATYIKTFDLPPALSANPGAGIYISTSVWFL